MDYFCIRCGTQVIVKKQSEIHWVKEGNKWKASCERCERLDKEKGAE